MVHIEDRDDLKKKINNKMPGYRRCDKKKIDFYPILNKDKVSFNREEALQLVDVLDSDKCQGCGCTMLFTNYKPYCYYQFSFDRINNKLIHEIDNLRIVCWNCNTAGMDSVKASCIKGCHLRLRGSQLM
jgi:hypothetical protein